MSFKKIPYRLHLSNLYNALEYQKNHVQLNDFTRYHKRVKEVPLYIKIKEKLGMFIFIKGFKLILVIQLFK